MAPSLKQRDSSARSAVHHWLLQRGTAIVLVPLVLWFVWIALPHFTHSSAETYKWLQVPHNAFFAFLWTILIFFHGMLGMQVVIEDYVSLRKKRISWIAVSKLLSFLGTLVGCVQILRIAFGF